jgi:uncharacterized protein YjiK
MNDLEERTFLPSIKMKLEKPSKWIIRNLSLATVSLGLILASSFLWTPVSFARAVPPPIWQVRAMQADRTGISEPMGLVFSSKLNAFYTIDARNWRRPPTLTDLVELTVFEDRAGSVRLEAGIQDPINMVYDNQANRLLVLQPQGNQLLEVLADQDGRLNLATLTRHNVTYFGVQNAQGLTIDAVNGDLFILDAVGPRIVHVSGGLHSGTVSVVDLASSGITAPRGIAFDPSTDHLQVVSQSEKRLYELTQTGTVVTSRDLSQFDLKDIQGIVFAPSGDQTDDPARMSLYLAVSGSSSTTQQTSSSIQSAGQIVELSLTAAASLPSGTTLLPATLVHIIDTSNKAWNPSAPDPAGVDYWPLTGRLLISDSEVEEMPNYWLGRNVYDATLSGTLVSTCTTYTGPKVTGTYNNFSNEPTGVAINPVNNHVFFSDDYVHKVFEVGPGPDGKYCSADDVLLSVSTLTFGSGDTEDVAYGNNTIFIAGGIDAEVYLFSLGPDGMLGGGDDGPMTHFDTAAWGFNDMEGIGYNRDSNTLFIVSTKGTERYLGEVSTTGTFLRAYDLSLMGTGGNKRSDVAYAPSSQDPAVKDIYIASRNIDNNDDPNENDGQIWEINIGSAPSDPTPTATPSRSPTSTNTPTNTPTPSNTPTSTATPTNTTVPIDTPTNTPTSTATLTPTPTATLVPGAPLTFPAIADAYVYYGRPTNNYGTNTALWVDGGTDPAYNAYLKFSVSGIPGTVQSAVLRLYVTNASVDGPALYGTSNTWTESGITWDTQPGPSTAVVDDKAAISLGTWVEYNVTSLVTGDGTYSFLLTKDTIDSAGFSSREGAQPSQLVITTGP